MNLNVVHPHVIYLVPIEAATPEIIDKVHDIVLTDRRMKVRELVEATGTVILILHEQLGMKKLSPRWVPRLLTVDHKPNVIQMNFCIDLLLWIKHGSITSHPRRRNSQNNGLHRGISSEEGEDRRPER